MVRMLRWEKEKRLPLRRERHRELVSGPGTDREDAT